MDERVAIFIDGSNLFYSVSEVQPPVRIDYAGLRDFLCNGRYCVRPNYYGSESVPPDQKQTRFYNFLRETGFNVKIFPLRRIGDRVGEKGVDVAIAIDMLSLAHKDAYDTAILVSGDKDFGGLVQTVKNEFWKKVEIAAFEARIANEFRLMADKFVPLNRHLEKFGKPK